MNAPVDIVIVTYNSSAVVGALLDSLPQALAPLPYRTVVVDNDSSDTTRAIVAARGDCLLVEAANDGYAAGINRGVDALGGGGPILVLNPDLVVAPGAVLPMIELLADPAVGIVVPLLQEADGTIARSLRRTPTLLRSVGLGDSRHARFSEVDNDPASYEHVHRVDWATGAAMLVSRACYDEIGAFDESFFMYSEETDFCLRAADHGYATLFTPAAAAVHIAGGSGRSSDLYTLQVLNRIRLYRRRNALAPAVAMYALTLLRESVWSVRGHDHSRRAFMALLSSRLRPTVARRQGSVLRSTADSFRTSAPGHPNPIDLRTR